MAEPDDRARFTFWAYFGGGDRGRPVRVDYRIPGHGSGSYQRHDGDRPVRLLRYDAAETWPRGGARLDRDGRWRQDESPYRNRLLGSNYGDPVSHEEAAEIIQQLGFSRELLYQPVEPEP
jgi:hypothetical protein